MSVTTFRVIAVSLVAFLFGHEIFAGECNIYCKNVYWSRYCFDGSYTEWKDKDCKECSGDGTSFCVDATTARRMHIVTFMFATGIENSVPTINGGRSRVDEMESCHHYDRWKEDFALVEEMDKSNDIRVLACEIRYLRRTAKRERKLIY